MTAVVVDASAIVDLLAGAPASGWIAEYLADADVQAPAHMLAEVLSAIGRLQRTGEIAGPVAEAAVRQLSRIAVTEHAVGGLVPGAWLRREQLHLKDALYVELAAQLDTVVVTTDRRLARATSHAVAPPE